MRTRICAAAWAGLFGLVQLLSEDSTVLIAGQAASVRGDGRIDSLREPTRQPAWAWVRHEGGAYYEGASHVAPDCLGNIYVLGGFDTSTALGTNTLEGSVGGSSFLAKYNARGDLLWVSGPGGSGIWSAFMLNVDASRGTCVAGTFVGELDFAGHKLVSTRREVGIVKVDPRGRVLWATQADVLAIEDSGFAVALDRRGNVILAGCFTGEIRTQETVLKATGLDGYFVKYDATAGRLLWARQSGWPEEDWPEGLAIDAKGNIYLGGATLEDGPPLPGAASPNQMRRAFISKRDSLGNELWRIRPEGSGGESHARALAVDPAGNVFLVGQFVGAFQLGGQRVQRLRLAESSFLARIRPGGQVAWLRSPDSTEFDQAVSIVVDQTGNAHVAGNFRGEAVIGSAHLNSTVQQAYVAKYDSRGHALWARQLESPSFSQALRLQVDRFGRVCLLAESSGLVFPNAAPPPSLNQAYPHLCILSWCRLGRRLWVQDFDSDTLQMWATFGLDPAGNCYVGGSFQETLLLGPTLLTSRGSRDFFLAKMNSGMQSRNARPLRYP